MGKKLFDLLVISALSAMTSVAHGATMYVHDPAGTLGTVDTDNGNVSIIGNMGRVMTDIAFDPNGNLFGITFSGTYSIDPTNASSSFVGSHGVPGGNGLVFGRDGTLYAAGHQSTNLFTIDPTSGASTVYGDMNFASAGDLAFVGSDLFLSSLSGELVHVDLLDPSASSAIGSFGVPDVFGIASDGTSSLFAVAGTSIYSVDLNTGAAMNGVSFAGQGLTIAAGESFFAESGADPDKDPSIPTVPLPAGLPLMLSGLLGLGMMTRRKKRA